MGDFQHEVTSSSITPLVRLEESCSVDRVTWPVVGLSSQSSRAMPSWGERREGLRESKPMPDVNDSGEAESYDVDFESCDIVRPGSFDKCGVLSLGEL